MLCGETPVDLSGTFCIARSFPWLQRARKSLVEKPVAWGQFTSVQFFSKWNWDLNMPAFPPICHLGAESATTFQSLSAFSKRRRRSSTWFGSLLVKNNRSMDSEYKSASVCCDNLTSPDFLRKTPLHWPRERSTPKPAICWNKRSMCNLQHCEPPASAVLYAYFMN